MSSQNPTNDREEQHAEDEQAFCEVHVPGLVRPLHICLERGFDGTTVEELRTLALAEMRKHLEGSGTAPPEFIRLIYRGKELRGEQRSLSHYHLVQGCAVHGMATRVRPHNQPQEGSTGRVAEVVEDVRAAGSAIGTAIRVLMDQRQQQQQPAGEATAEGEGDQQQQQATVERARLNNNELLRLLHQESMLRAASTGQQRRPQEATGTSGSTAPATAPAAPVPVPEGDGQSLSVSSVDSGTFHASVTGSSGPVQRQRSSARGRTRVATLSGAAGRDRDGEDAAAAAVDMAGGGGQEEVSYEEIRDRMIKAFVLAMLLGFFMGPIGFVFRRKGVETIGLCVGFGMNVLFFCLGISLTSPSV